MTFALCDLEHLRRNPPGNTLYLLSSSAEHTNTFIS